MNRTTDQHTRHGRAEHPRAAMWAIAAVALLGAGSASSCVVERDCQLTASCGTRTPRSSPPKVTMTWPADGEIDIPTRLSVVATFSAPLDASTVTPESFIVTNRLGEIVAGTVSYDDNAGATFVPDQPLALLTAHTLTLTDAITDSLGNPLAEAPVQRAFTTVDGVWEPPTQISTNTSDSVVAPDVAITPSGEVFVVWSTSPGERVWATRFDAAERTWSNPALVDDSAPSVDAQVAVDTEGNAVVAWRNTDAAIFANRFSWKNQTWGHAEDVSSNLGGRVGAPRAGIDSEGNATVIWEREQYTNTTVLAAHFEGDEGWATAQSITSVGSGTHSPDLAVAANGTVFATWHEGINATAVRVRRFTIETGWGEPQILDASDEPAFYPRIAASDDGAVAVWAQVGPRINLWASRFTSEGGWDAPALIEPNGGPVFDANVAMAPGVTSVAVWTQARDGIGSVWANASNPSDGWSDAVSLETGDGQAESPQVAMDRNGNAIAAWTQHDGTRKSIWSSRRNQAGTWAGAELRETGDGGDADSVQIAVAPNGAAVMVWRQVDGAQQHTWVSVFNAPKP